MTTEKRNRHVEERRYSGTCPLCGKSFERKCRKAPILCEACSDLFGYQRIKIAAERGVDLKTWPRAKCLDKPEPKEKTATKRRRHFQGNPAAGPGHQQPSGIDIPLRKEAPVRDHAPSSRLSDGTAIDENTCPSCLLPTDVPGFECTNCLQTSGPVGVATAVLRMFSSVEELLHFKACPAGKPVGHWDNSRAIIVNISENPVAIYIQRSDICVRNAGSERIARTIGSMKRSDSEMCLRNGIVAILCSLLERAGTPDGYRLAWITPAGEIVEK